MPITDANKTKLKLQDIVQMSNVAEKLSEDELAHYGRTAVDGYTKDMQSRREWEERNQDALKLALQVREEKSFPWTNCSNVKFPAVTIAALQFLARISILTKGRKLVKVTAWGSDADGKKGRRADRISEHMSFQLVQQDTTWLDDDEVAKFSASVLGCAIKKSYYDPLDGINRSEFVPLSKFVVDYWCKDLSKAHRASHLLDMTPNQIYERERRGLFLEMREHASPSQSQPIENILQQTADEAQGVRRPTNDSLEIYPILEQHTWLDLDGDGYAEPYVMYVRLDTTQVLRIVARYFDTGDVVRMFDGKIKKLEAEATKATDPKERSRLEREADTLEKSAGNFVLRIRPVEHFTKYTFIPSPDGGFYGLGFGALLGPTNAAIDTLLNQLVDSGTMANSAGGFLGRGVKIKSGKQSFDPFEWKPVDSPGNALKDNIFPLPVREPSTVLFQLLGLLIQYGEKIGSATDVMTGVNPGQNTPAETSRNTLEQGMMLFSGIYTRMYRAFAEELTKLYQLNHLYFKQSEHFEQLTQGDTALVAPDDYDNNQDQIYPSADPSSASQNQKRERASAVLQLAMQSPGGFNQYLVKRDFLEAMDVPDIDTRFPDPQGPNAVPPPQNPKIELEKAKLEFDKIVHADNMQAKIAELKQEESLSQAKITELQAKALKHMAEADGVDKGHQIALIEAQIGAQKLRHEGLIKSLDVIQKLYDGHMKDTLARDQLKEKANGKEPHAGGPGPVVAPSGDTGNAGSAA